MSKADTLLKEAATFERIALYSDRKLFLQTLAQENAEEAEEVVLPTDRVVGFASIPKDVQNMLSRIVTIEGVGLPLQIDGQLGPKTRNALNSFKAKFSIPNQFTDTSVFDVIKSTYTRNPEKYTK